MALGCTVAELEHRLSAQEFAEWIAFYNLEPWGWEADCYKAGIVAATIVNVNRSSKKAKIYDPADFVPGAKVKKTTDPKLLKAQLKLAFAPMKAKQDAKRSQIHDQGGKGDGGSPKAARTDPRWRRRRRGA